MKKKGVNRSDREFSASHADQSDHCQTDRAMRVDGSFHAEYPRARRTNEGACGVGG